MATSPAAQLVRARVAAGLSQRELAARACVHQCTVGRIETGAADPRTETPARLLAARGREIGVLPRPGAGVDRTQLRDRLRLTPVQPIRETTAAAKAIARLQPKDRAEVEILGVLRDERDKGGATPSPTQRRRPGRRSR